MSIGVIHDHSVRLFGWAKTWEGMLSILVTKLYSADYFNSGCRNASHCQRKKSCLGLLSTG